MPPSSGAKIFRGAGANVGHGDMGTLFDGLEYRTDVRFGAALNAAGSPERPMNETRDARRFADREGGGRPRARSGRRQRQASSAEVHAHQSHPAPTKSARAPIPDS